MKSKDNLDFKVTVEFTIKNACDKDSFNKEYKGDAKACLDYMMQHDCLMSFVEDDFRILNVRAV